MKKGLGVFLSGTTSGTYPWKSVKTPNMCTHVTRRRNSKDRKSNGQMYRYKITNNEQQNTIEKIKDLANRIEISGAPVGNTRKQGKQFLFIIRHEQCYS
jgi:hypothetical protein